MVIPAHDGAITITIVPLSGSGIQTSTTFSPERLDTRELAEIITADQQAGSIANPESLEARLISSGAFPANQTTCIVDALLQAMEPAQFAMLTDPYEPGRLHHTAGIQVGGAVHECIGDSLLA